MEINTYSENIIDVNTYDDNLSKEYLIREYISRDLKYNLSLNDIKKYIIDKLLFDENIKNQTIINWHMNNIKKIKNYNSFQVSDNQMTIKLSDIKYSKVEYDNMISHINKKLTRYNEIVKIIESPDITIENIYEKLNLNELYYLGY
jgi:hypothetical protein